MLEHVRGDDEVIDVVEGRIGLAGVVAEVLAALYERQCLVEGRLIRKAGRLQGVRDMALRLGRVILVVERPHRRQRVERVAQLDALPGRRRELRDVRVVDPLVDEDRR